MKVSCFASALILNQVSHNYGALPVIQNVDLVVNPGEFVVLVGPSGCGKSTLLSLIAGHLKLASGAIRSEGIIRTVYQQDGLFPWLTVSENISMGLRSVTDSTKQQADLHEFIELLHLQGFENYYPHQLSGGMKQRVELARVLAGNSDILLMDEPFSSLDYQARLHMRFELVRLLTRRPRTVIFVTHDVEEAAQLADRVLILSNRPATICRELCIDAPRPRNLTDKAVTKASCLILNELGLNNLEDSEAGNVYDRDPLVDTST